MPCRTGVSSFVSNSRASASRTKFHIFVAPIAACEHRRKDGGFEVDLLFRGAISEFVAVYLGRALWRERAGKALLIQGDPQSARRLPAWSRRDEVVRLSSGPPQCS